MKQHGRDASGETRRGGGGLRKTDYGESNGAAQYGDPSERERLKSLRAERVVLRMALDDPACALEATDRLGADDFAEDANRALFSALVMMRARGEPIEPAGVAVVLDAEPQLTGWTPRDVFELLEDPSAATAPANLDYYIGIVARKAGERHALAQLEGLAIDDEASPAVLRQAADTLQYARTGSRAPQSLRVEDLTDDLDDPDYLLVGMMEKGQVVLVVAPFKHGKTTFGMELSVSLAMGRRVGGPDGIVTCGKCVVIHVDQENPPTTVKRRFKLLGAIRAIESGRLHALIRPGVRLSQENGLACIRAKVEELRQDPSLADLPFVVVFDSWAGIADEQQQNDNGEREVRFRRLLDMCRELELSSIILGNTGHHGDHIKGGVVLDDLADGRLNLKMRDDGSRYLTMPVQRGDFDSPSDFDIHREQDADGRIRLTLSPHLHQPEELDNTDRRILRALVAGCRGPKAIAEHYASSGSPIGEKQVKRRREKLLKAGVLRIEKKTWKAASDDA